METADTEFGRVKFLGRNNPLPIQLGEARSYQLFEGWVDSLGRLRSRRVKVLDQKYFISILSIDNLIHQLLRQ